MDESRPWGTRTTTAAQSGVAGLVLERLWIERNTLIELNFLARDHGSTRQAIKRLRRRRARSPRSCQAPARTADAARARTPAPAPPPPPPHPHPPPHSRAPPARRRRRLPPRSMGPQGKPHDNAATRAIPCLIVGFRIYDIVPYYVF